MKTLYLDKEFDRIFDKLYRKENFSLLRYGDGEKAIMIGENFNAQEGWRFQDDKDFSKELFSFA